MTLIIAVGGIAAGIGAIWTAVVAMRQVRDQRKFLQEQSERERRRLEADLMHGMWIEWTSRSYQDFRRSSIKYVRDHYVEDGRLLQVDYMDGATRELFNFLDEMGYLTRAGVLRLERVLATHGASVRLGWALWEPAVSKERAEWEDSTLFSNYEYLYHKGLEFGKANRLRRWSAPPSTRELLHFVRDEWLKETEMQAALSEAADADLDGAAD